jgi:membrane protein
VLFVREEIKMTSPKLSKSVSVIWQQGIRIAKILNERTNGWLWVLANAVKETLMPDTAIMASAIAYIALFSLFPLILLSISLGSFSLGAEMDQRVVVQRLEFVAPALGQLLGQNIDEIIRARGPVTSFAVLGLAWSASTFFYTLTHTLNQIWKVKPRRPAWKRRGISILFVMLFVGPVLFLISFAGSVIANIRFWLPDQIIPFGVGVSLLLTLLLDVTLFMVLYMILPHGTSSWREVLTGAIGAGILWEFAKKTFLSFVSAYISITNLVYGTVATIIAFLLWAYISSLIFIFGAYLSVFSSQRKQKTTNTPKV